MTTKPRTLEDIEARLYRNRGPKGYPSRDEVASARASVARLTEDREAALEALRMAGQVQAKYREDRNAAESECARLRAELERVSGCARYQFCIRDDCTERIGPLRPSPAPPAAEMGAMGMLAHDPSCRCITHGGMTCTCPPLPAAPGGRCEACGGEGWVIKGPPPRPGPPPLEAVYRLPCDACHGTGRSPSPTGGEK